MKAFQYLIAICLCCIFSIHSFAQTLYKVTAERVNVRNKPSSQALVVGVVNKGDIISVSEISNGWATILFKDKTRYMDARYIEPTGNVKGADNQRTGQVTRETESVESNITPSPSKLSQFKHRNKKEKEKKARTNKPHVVRNGDMSFICDIFGGYSNFRCDEVSPEFGFGFGADFGLQYDYSRLWGKMPQGLFGEITIGYSCRGSGAYPIHYVGSRVLPIGYRYSINSDLSVVGKAGLYVAYPFSKIETSHDSYSTCLDFGISVGLGVEWKQFGLHATYEHGFADVKDGGRVELYNQGIFLTFSYKIHTF